MLRIERARHDAVHGKSGYRKGYAPFCCSNRSIGGGLVVSYINVDAEDASLAFVDQRCTLDWSFSALSPDRYDERCQPGRDLCD